MHYCYYIVAKHLNSTLFLLPGMAIQPSLEQRVRNSLFCLAGITAAVGLNGCGTKTEGPIAPLDGTPSQAASTNNTRSVGGQTITFNQGSRAFGLGRRVDVTVKTGDAVVRYIDGNGDGYVDTVSVQSTASGPTSTYSRGNTYLNDVITEAQQGYHDAVNSYWTDFRDSALQNLRDAQGKDRNPG